MNTSIKLFSILTLFLLGFSSFGEQVTCPVNVLNANKTVEIQDFKCSANDFIPFAGYPCSTGACILAHPDDAIKHCKEDEYLLVQLQGSSSFASHCLKKENIRFQKPKPDLSNSIKVWVL